MSTNRVELRQDANQKLADASKESTVIATCARTTEAGVSVTKTEDTTLYIVANIGAGGNQELFKSLSKNVRVVGETNFDGNRLNSMRNAVIDGIQVIYGTAAVASPKIGDIDFKPQVVPAPLKNSEIRLVAENRQLFEIPVQDVLPLAAATSNNDSFRNLSHLPVIEAMKNATLNLDFPATYTALDTALNVSHWVKVLFRVSQTVER